MAGPFRHGKFGTRSLNKMAAKFGGSVPAASGASVEHSGGVTRSTFKFAAKAIPLLDAAGVVAYAGLKFFDFPEGNIVILDAIANLTMTKSSAGVIDAFDGDFSVGTVTASNNATLTATEQDIIPSTSTPQATGAGLAAVTTLKGRVPTSPIVLDGTGGAKAAFLNLLIDDTDHDVTTTPASLIVTGSITIIWTTAGDF